MLLAHLDQNVNKLLKNAFKVIIENLIFENNRGFKALFNEGTQNEVIDYYEKHKNTKRKGEPRNIRELFWQYNFSESCLATWRNDNETLRNRLFKVENMIKKLLKVRNEMFQMLQNMHDYLMKSGHYKNYQKSDFAEINNFAKASWSRPEATPIKIWNLKTKPADSDEYASDCFSE